MREKLLKKAEKCVERTDAGKRARLDADDRRAMVAEIRIKTGAPVAFTRGDAYVAARFLAEFRSDAWSDEARAAALEARRANAASKKASAGGGQEAHQKAAEAHQKAAEAHQAAAQKARAEATAARSEAMNRRGPQASAFNHTEWGPTVGYHEPGSVGRAGSYTTFGSMSEAESHAKAYNEKSSGPSQMLLKAASSADKSAAKHEAKAAEHSISALIKPGAQIDNPQSRTRIAAQMKQGFSAKEAVNSEVLHLMASNKIEASKPLAAITHGTAANKAALAAAQPTGAALHTAYNEKYKAAEVASNRANSTHAGLGPATKTTEAAAHNVAMKAHQAAGRAAAVIGDRQNERDHKIRAGEHAVQARALTASITAHEASARAKAENTVGAHSEASIAHQKAAAANAKAGAVAEAADHTRHATEHTAAMRTVFGAKQGAEAQARSASPIGQAESIARNKSAEANRLTASMRGGGASSEHDKAASAHHYAKKSWQEVERQARAGGDEFKASAAHSYGEQHAVKESEHRYSANAIRSSGSNS